MNRLYVALHGNPGFAGDLSALTDILGVSEDTLFFDANIKPLTLAQLLSNLEQQVAERKAKEIIIIAYSWGSYLGVQWLQKTKQPVRSVILLNPTLVGSNPITPFARFLAGLPVIGNLLLKKRFAEKVSEIIERMFYPAKPPAAYRQRFIDFLSSPVSWRNALIRKVIEQEEPIPKQPLQIQPQFFVLRGLGDKLVPWDLQFELLDALELNSLLIKALDGAGHAAPWSHTDQIAALISELP